ncbi:MAG: BlaI/MecI/CopY family transcriptional regulator [Acidimicrobiales bacterium]
MSSTVICENPKCSCESCTCADCQCGVAKLGELERRVIEVLWNEPGREQTGREVANALSGYAYTTVATVLDRLTHKGLVRRRLEGRTIRFAATGTGATHTAVVMYEALEETPDLDAALVRFAETISDAEAAALRRALDKSIGTARRRQR